MPTRLETTMPLDLGAPAAEITRLAAGIRDDQLSLPTPCPGTDVAAMLAHLIGLSIAFRDGAAKIIGPTTTTAPAPEHEKLVDDWRDQLPLRVQELAEAWRDPAAWEGETTVGGATMPAAIMGVVGNSELVVHGWDLAVSTGQAYHPAQANLEASFGFVSNTPDDPDVRRGLFGPVVIVPDDAPLLDRTLAFSGRSPAWTSPEL
jgi:uncharacterized protein (TIGR03086 family)